MYARRLENWRKQLTSQSNFFGDVSRSFAKIKFDLRSQAMNTYESTTSSIRDDVWGSVQLSNNLRTLINTPLIQKGRNIPYNGLLYLYYPGARFSLFDSLIGRIHVTNQYIEELRLSDLYTEDQILTLQIALCFSDMAMLPGGSPATLLALKNDSTHNISVGGITRDQFFSILLNSIPELTEEGFGRLKSIQPWRILSAGMLLSEEMSFYFRKNLKVDDVDSVISNAVSLILGLRISPDDLILNHIISGQLSAANIDNLFRSGKACGYTPSLDFGRFIEGIITCLTDRQSVKDMVVIDRDNGEQTLKILAQGGGNTNVIFDFIDSVNQRTRNLDTDAWPTYLRVRSAQLLEDKYFRDSQKVEELCDFFELWPQGFDEFNLGAQDAAEGRTRIISHQLSYRQLGKRAAVIGARHLSMPTTHYEPDLIKRRTIREFRKSRYRNVIMELTEEFKERDNRRAFEKEITESGRDLVTELNGVGTIKFHSGLEISDEPTEITIVSSVLPSSNLLGFDEFVAEKEPSGSLINHIVRPNYNSVSSQIESEITFYSDEIWRRIIRVVLEKILYKKYSRVEFLTDHELDQIGTTQKILSCPFYLPPLNEQTSSKFGSDVSRLKNRLAELHFYDDCPSIFELSSSEKDLCASLQEKFKTYAGEGGFRVNSDHIQAFVRQFPPGLRADVINLIHHLHLITRHEIEQNFHTHAEELSNNSNYVHMVPLSTSSGGSIFSMINYKRLQNVKFHASFSDFSDLLENEQLSKKSVLVFYDDNIMSGTQSSRQFEYWISGKDCSEEKLDKTRLSETQKAQLKGLQIEFSFIVASDKGRQKLLEIMKSYGFDPKKIRFKTAHNSSELSGRKIISEELRLYLSEIGKQVYRYKKHEENEEIDDGNINSRCLGFDNFEGIFFTISNIPTSMYTALWCPGVIDIEGVTMGWVPLFIRNKNLSLTPL